MSRRFSTEFVQWPPIKKPDGEDGKDRISENELPPVSKWRIAFPQILASSAKNLLLMDLGMTIAFSTIVVPVLLDRKDTQGLVFSEEEASWFSSIIFLCQPLGSVVSGLLLEPIGRKKAMMVVNVPHIMGWLLFYFSSSKTIIYIAATIMGLGIGFMEAPIITYVGEIAEPRLRGTLTSYANLFVTFGMNAVFVIGAFVDWRTTAAISTLVPIITILAISQVPETPIWLLGKGKKEEAEKALCWLRGWVEPEYVKAEFDELSRYSETSKLKKNRKTGVINPGFISDDGTPAHNHKDHVELSLSEKARDFMRPGMMKPLGFIIAFFFFGNFTGITSTRPYMEIIAKELHMPLKPSDAAIVFGSVGFFSSVLCMVTIALFKKRPIALFSMIVAAGSAFCLCFSTDPWVTFIAYTVLTFASLYGANGLVWTLVSEVFPFRGRSLASGIAAAASYLISFFATKSYQSLKDWLTLQWTFGIYGVISVIGLVYLYFCMPETEGRPLEDIEREYEKRPSVQSSNQNSNVV